MLNTSTFTCHMLVDAPGSWLGWASSWLDAAVIHAPSRVVGLESKPAGAYAHEVKLPKPLQMQQMLEQACNLL